MFKDKLKVKGFGCLLSIFLSVALPLCRALAETPALRGLGESVEPASLAQPEKLGPPAPSESSSQGSNPSPVLLRPVIQKSKLKEPFTLSGAVRYADLNYPAIMRAQAQMRGARENITVQKLNEYLPDSLIQWQEVMASHNKLTQIMYGSTVFPGNPGPGLNFVSMEPLFFSGVGFSLDWVPLDFGLHKARIQLAKEQYKQSSAQYAVTELDVQIAAANAFLDVIEAVQQVQAAQENVNSFMQFNEIVAAEVNAELKPGADKSLAEAQLANASNQLLRAKLNYDVARAGLANSLGLGGIDVDVVERGIVEAAEPSFVQQTPPVFEQVPILQATKATVLTALAQRRVLNKEYFPVFHLLGGVQNRGAGLNTKGQEQSANVYGLIPCIPNYQVAVIGNWNFLDWFRLRAEKRVQDQRIQAQQNEYSLVLQNLKTEDVRARARVRTAIAIAKNMPVQVYAAEQAARQAVARYKVGLSNVAQVAESNQLLAQSRMQEAAAKVSVWRAILGVASVHGNLKPFLAEADRAQRGM